MPIVCDIDLENDVCVICIFLCVCIMCMLVCMRVEGFISHPHDHYKLLYSISRYVTYILLL